MNNFLKRKYFNFNFKLFSQIIINEKKRSHGKWSKNEDLLLNNQVNSFLSLNKEINWKEISQAFTGLRSYLSCKKRWNDLKIVKEWSIIEDRKLRKLVNQQLELNQNSIITENLNEESDEEVEDSNNHDKSDNEIENQVTNEKTIDWETISLQLKRDQKSCEERWSILSTPKITQTIKSTPKSGPWTPKEDEILVNMMKSSPRKTFVDASKALNYTRSPIQCKFRWNILSTSMDKKSLQSDVSIIQSNNQPNENSRQQKDSNTSTGLTRSKRVWSNDEIKKLLIAISKSRHPEDLTCIDWDLVWIYMNCERNPNDYRLKYRTSLLPKLNQLTLETDNSNFEIDIDESDHDLVSNDTNHDLQEKFNWMLDSGTKSIQKIGQSWTYKEKLELLEIVEQQKNINSTIDWTVIWKYFDCKRTPTSYRVKWKQLINDPNINFSFKHKKNNAKLPKENNLLFSRKEYKQLTFVVQKSRISTRKVDWKKVAELMNSQHPPHIYKQQWILSKISRHIRRRLINHTIDTYIPWKTEDIDNLRDIVNNFSSSDGKIDWFLVFKRMNSNHSPYELYTKWNELNNLQTTATTINYRSKSRWTIEEIERLKEAIVIARHPNGQIDWQSVELLMNGTKSRKSCQDQLKYLSSSLGKEKITKLNSKQIFNNSPPILSNKKWTEDEVKKFKKIVPNCINTNGRIDWNKVLLNMNYGRSIPAYQSKFLRLK